MEKTQIKYHYDKEFEIEYCDGYTSAFNTNGFAIFSFFYEYPNLLDKTYLSEIDGGTVEEVEDHKLTINRKVHTSIRCDLDLLKRLHEDIGSFLEEMHQKEEE